LTYPKDNERVKTMIKAVIFDFDGLILDTETPWYEAFSAVYQEHGAYLPVEEWALCIGTTFKHFDPYQDLESRIGKSIDRAAIQKSSLEKHTVIMKQKCILPGVEDCLKTAKSLGLKIGLASSSERSWVENFLQQFQLVQFFDSILTQENVKNVKPDPELYQKSLLSFGISGGEAIAFEDSPNGSKAAKAAGMHCVVIPNAITARLQFEKDNYDIMLSSMAEMDLKDIIKTLGTVK
jgi:putative hydrolase of the HAD superfamily